MTILAIGGHSGDVEVMAGALLHKYARHGHRIISIGLTTGDGGHPTLSRPEYRKQKDREAVEAAGILGFECRLFSCSSGQLAVSVQVQEELAEIIRETRPEALITHWKESIHRDHTAAHYNALQALALAKLPYSVPVFFGDNWEDRWAYCPDLLITLETEDVETWEKACASFQFFRDSFYQFPYRQYYRNLFFNRGAEGRVPLANALMHHNPTGRYTEKEIPGIPL